MDFLSVSRRFHSFHLLMVFSLGFLQCLVIRRIVQCSTISHGLTKEISKLFMDNKVVAVHYVAFNTDRPLDAC